MREARSREVPGQRDGFHEFPVGTRVWVVTRSWDFIYFSSQSEPAVVTQNDGRYDGIRVRFEQPRVRWDDGQMWDNFNFNPVHLQERQRRADGQYDDDEPVPPMRARIS